MKRRLRLLGTLVLLCVSLILPGQTYLITNSALDVGNPGGLRTVSDATNTGGTSILNGGTGSTTINTWSAATAIPFSFNFYGTPVTHFIVSKNGLLTFDTTNANQTVGAALNVNTALPNASLPDNTIAFFWEDTSSTSISTGDHVYIHTEGTAPNRQFWVRYFSFEVGTQSFCYWAVVLEESTDKIYVVDMNYAGSPASYTGTVGFQQNAGNAVQVSTPLNGTLGSPNIIMGSGSSGITDNEYYEFLYLPPGSCLPPTNLMSSALTSTSGTCSWTTGGAANALVEYGPAGFTLGTGTQIYVTGGATSANMMGLSPNTTYDVYVKDSCITNASVFVGPSTFTTPCSSTMSGTYTINGAVATGGTNFQTFGEAAAELNACGISGPVTINVVQGTYTEQIMLDSIEGASAVNPVIIQADPGNTNPAILTYAATGTGDNYVIDFNNTDYVTISGLQIDPTGQVNGYARAIVFEGNGSNITIDGCTINSTNPGSTSTNYSPIYNNTGSANRYNDCSITNNTIVGGSYVIYWYGISTTDFETGNTISNNSITGYYYMGIYALYQDGLSVTGNTIMQDDISPYTTGYGVYNYYSDNSDVSSNMIVVRGTSTNYGIYNYYNDASAIAPNIISNNMISCLNNSGTTYGIYPYNNYYTDIVYNSVNVTGGSATAGRAIYLNSSTTGTYGFVNLQNNNFVNTGGGYAAEISSGATTLGYVSSSDYNNFYGSGATLIRANNTNYADLMSYQMAAMTFDQNSVSGDPLFNGPDNLHVSSPVINNVGSPYAGITTDIDGDIRSGTTPDIGADEFSPPSCLPSSGLTVTSLGPDSAVVSWIAGTGTTFNLEYDTAGFAQGTGTVVMGIVDTFYVITGLNSSTSYDFYVQDDCGGSGLSPWSGPGSFSTLIQGPVGVTCLVGSPAVLFTEDWDVQGVWTGDFSTSNGYWDYQSGSTGSGSTGPSGAYSGSNYVYFEASTGGLTTASIVSPVIDLTSASGGAELSFWLHAYGADIGTLDVGVGTSAAGPFTNVFSFGPGQLQSASTDPWQNVGVNLDTYLGQGIYLEFKYTRNGTGFTGDLAVDLIEVTSCASCLPPTNQGAYNITSSSADLFWTTGGATNWNVEYDTSGFSLGTGNFINATNDTLSVASLLPNTSYDFYVRDSCGTGNVSAWVGPFTFVTPCAPFTAPYTETFDGTSDPACWSNYAISGGPWFYGGAGTNSVNCSGAPDHTGNGGNYAWMDQSGTDVSVYLEMNDVDVSGLTNPMLQFYYWMCGVGYTPINATVVEAWNGSAWVVVDSIDVATNGWEQRQYLLTGFTYGSGLARIRFRAESGGSGSDFYGDNAIDDVSIMEAPTCPDPTGLNLVGASDVAATVNWTTGGATNWNLSYGAPGFSPNGGTIVNPTSTTYTITSLTAGTQYEVYVRDSCGVGDVSNWVGPLSLTTSLCDTATTCTHTFILSDSFGDGWNGSEVTVYQGGVPVGILGGNDFTGATGNPPGDTLVTQLVLCDNLPTVLVITTGTNGFPNYASEIGVEVISAGGNQLAFYDNNASASTGDTIATFTSSCLLPTCPAPTALGAANITDISADIFWTGGGASNWDIEYGAAGFTPGTGTMMSVTNDTVSLAGLTSGTCYDFYVRDSCGVGSSSTWSGPHTFCTLVCPPANQCTFTMVLGDDFGDGWNGTEVTVYQGGVAVGTLGGPNFTGADGNPPGDTLVTTMDLCDGIPAIFAITTGTNGTPNWSEEISVEVIDQYGIQVAFYDNSPTANQGDTIITLSTSCAAPACLPPSALGAYNLTVNSADLYWTAAAGAVSFEVQYGAPGFAVGSGTSTTSTNDTLALTGLMSSSCYQFYVRAICGPGDTSIWVGPSTFCTLCAPITTYPYFEDFSNPPSTAFPPCYSTMATNANGAFNWYVNSGTTTSGSTGPAGDHTTNFGLGNYVYTEASSPAASGDSAMMMLPEFNMTSLTNPEFVFWYHMYGADITTLYLQVQNGGSWTTIDSIVGQQQSGSGVAWLQRRIPMAAYTSATNLQLRFLHIRGGSFNGDAAIDDIEIREIPPCLDPTGLTRTAITTNSVTLAWNSDTNVTASAIQYGPPGFNLGTGTTVGSGAAGGTVTGLTPGTCYEFYVLDSCGAATNWIGPVLACTRTTCTVTGTPTNVMGDSTGCGGGPVTLTGTPSGGNDLLWESGGVIVGTGSPFNADSIPFTTIFEASNYNTSGPNIHLGPLPSIATAGFGNFTNGQWVTVMDTIIIDSMTVRSNGYVSAQMIITDKSVSDGGIIQQRGAIFTTDSNLTLNTQVPVGVVLTPGQYFISVDFLPGTTGSLFRATGGAVYPYVEPGLMSIDSVNFAGPRYYYSFDLVLRQACIGSNKVAAIGYVPGANAGINDSVTVCETDSAVDLTTFLGTYDFGGTWTDDDASGALTDSIFDATAVTVGGTYRFTYRVNASGGCTGADSATIAVTVQAAPYAGIDTADAICKGATVQLMTYLPGATTGGTFADLDGSGALSGSFFLSNNAAAGTYRIRYRVVGGACPTDSAIITITVDDGFSAGTGTSDTICDSVSPVDLTNYINGTFAAGGTWVDVDGTGAVTGSSFDPGAVTSGQSYNFRYVVNNSCGMDSTTVTLFVENCPIGLPELTVGTLDIYPNPTNGLVTIEAIDANDLISVDVYDMNGKLVISRKIDGKMVEINLGNFADGLYNVKIETTEGTELHRIHKK